MEQLPSKENQENKIIIPEKEINYEYFRSSAPGGQNVNKLNSGVRLRFNINKSDSLTDEEKQIIQSKLKNRINEKGELLIENEETRSQLQNKENAYQKLIELITEALEAEKERVPTTISPSVKKKRLEEKKKISEKKKLRKIKPE
ncbi:MAG: alternative ribosome rescue aminoacyl-tRNA hydrolase ArfB, partial [Minisyncoccia bacterium]